VHHSLSHLKQTLQKHPYVILFGASLIARLLFVIAFGSNNDLRWDGPYYDLLATRIISGYGFSFPTDAYHTAVANQPTSFQEPLYPLVLAAIYALFGVGNHLAIYFTHALLGALTVIVVFELARHVFGFWTGILAASAATFYPPFLFFTSLLMTDTLFIFLLMLVVYLTISRINDQPGLLDIATGLLIGFGALTRSVMVAVFLVLILFLAWFGWRRKASSTVFITRATLIGASAFLVIAPWTVRNYRIHKTLIPISTKLGYNLYFYNFPSDDYRFNERIVTFPDVSNLREPEREKLLRTMGQDFIRSSPAMFAKYAFIKFLDFWRPLPSEANSNLVERVVSLVSFPPVLVLGVIGFFIACCSRLTLVQGYAWLSFAILGLWLIQAMVFTGGFKARVAVEPTFIVFGSYAVARLAEKYLKLPIKPGQVQW
jgi:4-amino-4-deoxy-L-arabinose transferase-like glycosyltransferase